jgi:hypothetical protein
MKKITVRAWFHIKNQPFTLLKFIKENMPEVIEGCSDIPYTGNQYPYSIYDSRIVIIIDSTEHLSQLLCEMVKVSAMTEILLSDDEWYQIKK